MMTVIEWSYAIKIEKEKLESATGFPEYSKVLQRLRFLKQAHHETKDYDQKRQMAYKLPGD